MKYVIIVLLTATFAWTQPGPFDGCKGMQGRGVGRMEERLDMNTDQQKQVEAFRSDMQKKQIDLMAKVKTLRVEVRDLYNSENPDQKAIESKMNEISKLQNEMKLNHTNFWFSVNKILTAEQKKIWKESGCLDRPGITEGSRGHFGQRGGRGDGFERGSRNHRHCDSPCR